MTMTNQDSNDLLRVAEAIADGAKINWRDSSLSRESLQGPLDRLRMVEKIRSVHLTASTSPLERTSSGPLPATSDHRPLNTEVPETWGPLKIIERIGGGGDGEVYRAHDPALQKDVALKLLYAWTETNEDGDIDEGILREGRRLAAVQHENVLTVHGAARHDGRVGLWTDLVDGQTLEQCLARQGAMGYKEASVIGMELCRALAAVHREDMVHGDVKASNVMREANSGRIILMDFSSVRERRAPLGRAEPLCGTPIYMAPELLQGRDVGVASDIYSLGVLLYRLVTQRFPVEAGSVRELLDKMSQNRIKPLREVRPDLPRRFIKVVERALAFDPENRYHSVADMERDLEKALQRKVDPLPINFWQIGAAVAMVAVFIALRWWLAPFDVEASIHRANSIGTPALADGAQVSPGDSLFLEIANYKKMHVYVINSSKKDQYSALFPMSEFDLENPVPVGRHRLPGTINGQSRSWRVGPPEGQETILVVASLSPLEDLERAMKQMHQARANANVRRIAGNRRSIDSHIPSPDPQELEAIVAVLAAGNDGSSKKVRIFEFHLSNPTLD